MFDIDESMLISYGSTESYEDGYRCYKNNSIKKFDLDKQTASNVEKTVLTAKVQSTKNTFKKYDVRISFTNYSTSVHGVCNCMSYPRFYNQGNMCKHILAVLFKYCREKKSILEQKNRDINKFLLTNIKNTFTNSSLKVETKTLNLGFKLISEGKISEFLSLELKIGENRLYVVKNLKDFCESLLNNNSLELGKNFIYNSSVYKISKEDKEIVKIILDLYEIDKASENLAGINLNHTKFLSGKRLFLPDAYADKILDLLKERTVDLSLGDDLFKDVMILKEDLPLEFKLESQEEGLSLYQYSPLPLPITKSENYYFYDNSIYIPSTEQVIIYRPFYEVFIKQSKPKLNFSQEETTDIASYLIPALNKISKNVLVDRNIEEQFYKENLKTIVYFDKDNELITATVLFKYGDLEFNALKNTQDKFSDKFLVRDIKSENEIINIFIFFGFEKKVYNFTIENEEKFLDFIITGKNKLEDMCDIYYSESFKAMKVYTPKSYRSSIRLNREDLLEFAFSIDGVDKRELKNIFEAIKQKKKYYKLKKGGFVYLESQELKGIAEMVDFLNINSSELQNENIVLPKYNSLYINEFLKESNLNLVERDDSVKLLSNRIKEITNCDYKVPEQLDNVLRDYQKLGFKWFKTLSSCGFGGILADEMGLGKTIQTISFIKSEVDCNDDKMPSLVVCPTSLVYNWEDEITKFQPDLKALVISGNKNDREEQMANIETSDVVITSYALIRRDIEDYKNIKFRYCFLDEAQNIKNPEALNTLSVKSINAKGYFALTGTPIENSLTELWSIFDFIMPGYLLNHRKFVQKYEIPIVRHGNKKVLEILNKHIKPFILRRLKKDVIKELPPKIEHNVIVDMTEEQKKVYAAFLNEAREVIQEEIRGRGFNKSKIKILSILTRLRQICCDPSTFIENYEGENGKQEALSDIIENNIAEGHKILLFSQFTSVLKNIAKNFNEQKINYMYLDGSTNAEERIKLVREFNESNIPIFLISLKAGGTGLNLTSADIVIHYDPWWNPAVEAQASDRAHRIGQKNTVEVIKLITRGTIEEKIYAIQEKKKELINNVIDENLDDDIFLSNITEEELHDLFI